MSSKKILVPYDFAKNEIQNAVLQVLASAPSSPVQGQMYFDSVSNRPFWRTASAWIDLTDRANHSGTQLAVTISDLATTVQAYRLDQFAVPTADLSLNSHKLTNVTDGTSAQDAVTVNQLNSVLQGRTFKDAVRAATTANGTLATAYANGQVIDGVTLATGDRILLKDQTTGADNGIYVVAAAGAPTRAVDADTTGELKAGSSVQVAEGTANGDKQFTLTTDGTITIGTTAQTWAVTGAGTTYVQGTGISISGSTISVDTTVVARKYAVDVGDGSSTTIAVTHGLATVDILVQLFDKTSGATVECDHVRTSTSNLNLIFAVAPTAAQYRVVVHG